MSLKRILAAPVIASLVCAGVAQPAFAAATPAAGRLDPAFGAGGKVLISLPGARRKGASFMEHHVLAFRADRTIRPGARRREPGPVAHAPVPDEAPAHIAAGQP